MRRPVKSPAGPGGASIRARRGRHGRRARRARAGGPGGVGGSAWVWAWVLAGSLGTAPAGAQLLGGGGLGPKPPRPPPDLDPRIPRGAEQAFRTRPARSPDEPPVCSLTSRAVCVHRGEGASDETALAWLSALEQAHERLFGALGLAAPLSDGTLGGSGAIDVYLSAGEAFSVALDPPLPLGDHDATSAFCVAPASGSALQIARAATLCLAEVKAASLDAGETPFVRRAFAEHLWLVTGRPTSEDARAIDDAQSHPEQGILSRDLTRYAEGSAIFAEHVSRARGRGDLVAYGVTAYALSGWGRSPPGPRFGNEPDVFDVLRATFGPKPSDVARVFADFALARASLGSRDAEGAFPELAWVGDFGRPRFEWSVPWSSLPRKLVPSRPVGPLGTTYLWIDLDAPPADATFVLQAEWEEPVSFQWVIALVGPRGETMRRIDVPFVERGTTVERTVGDLEGARGILVAGTNLGGIGPSYPFDPDFEPFESHSYSVHLARL